MKTGGVNLRIDERYVYDGNFISIEPVPKEYYETDDFFELLLSDLVAFPSPTVAGVLRQ